MLQLIKNFIAKLQALPHAERVTLFVIIMALAVIIGGYLAIRSTINIVQ